MHRSPPSPSTCPSSARPSGLLMVLLAMFSSTAAATRGQNTTAPAPDRAAAPESPGGDAARQGPVGLAGLPALARERSARQRPEQLAALAPFLPDLELDPDLNAQVLADRIAQVAALGDGIVPLLLEKLTPASATRKALDLSTNCAKVLAHLEPVSFLDALLELANGTSTVARRHAIYLLGLSGHPSAAEAITRLFAEFRDPVDARVALDAMTRLGSPALADAAAAQLGSPDGRLRAAALDYLAAAGTADAVAAVANALAEESDDRLLPKYIAYLSSFSRNDGQVAEALLPLVEGVRLGPTDLRELCQALGQIAPKGHQPTIRAMRAFLERGETDRLGVAAAKTLERLGDAEGVKILFDKLDENVKKRSRRLDAYAKRADAYVAFERWGDAVRDYERALGGHAAGSVRNLYYLQIALCEAHRGQTSQMIAALKDSGLGLATIANEASRDPVFAEALQKEAAQRFLKGLEHPR